MSPTVTDPCATHAANVAELPVNVVRSTPRDLALDVVKGACVIAMILYHSVGYFPGSDLSLKYFGFVTGAFILLAGYVATSIYLRKHDARSRWRAISVRLAIRGAKLVVLTVLLNLLVMALLPGGKWKQGLSIGTMLWNLFTGADYRAVSFDLLVLIGYCLLAVALAFALGRGGRIVVVFVAVAAIVCAFLSNYNEWRGNYYTRLFAIGQMGALIGLLCPAAVQKLASHLEFVLVCYFIQLLLFVILPPDYLLYLLNLFCTLMAVYSLGSRFNSEAWLSRKIVLLGQYSLLAYLFQIAWLQALRRVMPVVDEPVLVAIAVTCVATLVCVQCAHWLRKRAGAFERAYRFVFC